MKIGKRHIDHIVYAVPDLEEACKYLEWVLGVTPVFGGYHKTQGTKNALLNLGASCYLEILAIDDSNELIKDSRWMGVDFVNEARVARWAIKSDSLLEDQQNLRHYNPTMGEIFAGSRETPAGDLLEWEMILPLVNPAVELAPFMVNWSSSSVHPTEALSEVCALHSIEFGHENPKATQDLFESLNVDHDIKDANEAYITIQIEAKSGKIVRLR